MPSEFSPGWGQARMTKAQMRKYLREAKKARELAAQKLKEAEASGELAAEEKELEKLEEKLDNL